MSEQAATVLELVEYSWDESTGAAVLVHYDPASGREITSTREHRRCWVPEEKRVKLRY